MAQGGPRLKPRRIEASRHASPWPAALDIYVWLTYRLHHLDKRAPIG
ncbi:hypothetical protein F0Q34_16110 [Pseudoroseomonas oryzae]|uniref:Uncharacterized protein n=1 Tax=Teichococcus oryzae TaxID=1608942 RepID=A0A5B2TEE0_9PROT|nr:hypothetical protein F0Q34_16110 [Pseudoroseomonas oryzae]